MRAGALNCFTRKQRAFVIENIALDVIWLPFGEVKYAGVNLQTRMLRIGDSLKQGEVLRFVRTFWFVF